MVVCVCVCVGGGGGEGGLGEGGGGGSGNKQFYCVTCGDSSGPRALTVACSIPLISDRFVFLAGISQSLIA